MVVALMLVSGREKTLTEDAHLKETWVQVLSVLRSHLMGGEISLRVSLWMSWTRTSWLANRRGCDSLAFLGLYVILGDLGDSTSWRHPALSAPFSST